MSLGQCTVSTLDDVKIDLSVGMTLGGLGVMEVNLKVNEEGESKKDKEARVRARKN